MKVLKKNINLIEAKSLQSFLLGHNITASLSNEYGLDATLLKKVSVSVQDDDYNQAVRLLKELDFEEE